MTLKALSIKHPWAWLILSGDKDIENRTWEARYMVGKRFAIHVSRKVDERAYSELAKHSIQVPRPQDFITLGNIVGTAVLDKIVTESDSFWFSGPYGFVLKDVRELPKPIPCRGALGFWKVPEGIEMEILDWEVEI